MFSFLEQNKSVLLADALRAQRARTFGVIPDSLMEEEKKIQQSLDETKKELITAKSNSAKALLLAKYNGLNQSKEEYIKALEAKFPKYFKAKYKSNIASVADIQQYLDDKTMMLEYFIGDSIVYALALTKTTVKTYAFAVAKELTLEIENLRKAISDYAFITREPEKARKQYLTSAYWFYKNLVALPLADIKGINSLLLVSDGELGHLPFEAFLTKEVKGAEAYAELPYLLNDFKVYYNYSASLWKENMEQPQKEGNNRMLAYAASYNNTKDSGATRTVRAPHLRNLRDALIDLPAAKQEVEALSGSFVGDFLYGKDADEAGFKEKAGDYSIIHLAMHGILNTQYPILSSLAFTEDGDSLEDNFLQAYEISQLQLNAQLVVLSACETGYGKFQQGEGVMSLARSFMYAGVPSLVVSMWQVNDASTSIIMQAFYKNLAAGMDKAEALRQAKLTYIGGVDGLAAHPAFWAPFVQLGDSRAISVGTIHESYLRRWGWIGGGLAAVAAVGGGAVAMRRKRRQGQE